MKFAGLLSLALICFAACTSSSASPQGGSSSAHGIRIERAVVWTLASARSGSAGMLIHCTTTDTLLAVEVAGATSALHGSGGGGVMTALERIPCTAGATLALRGQGDHIMLTDWSPVPTTGDTVSISLHWAQAGILPVKAPVLSYSQAQSLLQP